ncbi:hypothetical protein HDE_13923 [Halotydeus destructor]|nr:hypothetical protein HDE_13923 [Halotydeus destructor]
MYHTRSKATRVPAANGKRLFRVDQIEGKRWTVDGAEEYYIKWRGFPSSFNSWEPKENLTSDLVHLADKTYLGELVGKVPQAYVMPKRRGRKQTKRQPVKRQQHKAEPMVTETVVESYEFKPGPDMYLSPTDVGDIMSQLEVPTVQISRLKSCEMTAGNSNLLECLSAVTPKHGLSNLKKRSADLEEGEDLSDDEEDDRLPDTFKFLQYLEAMNFDEKPDPIAAVEAQSSGVLDEESTASSDTIIWQDDAKADSTKATFSINSIADALAQMKQDSKDHSATAKPVSPVKSKPETRSRIEPESNAKPEPEVDDWGNPIAEQQPSSTESPVDDWGNPVEAEVIQKNCDDDSEVILLHDESEAMEEDASKSRPSLKFKPYGPLSQPYRVAKPSTSQLPSAMSNGGDEWDSPTVPSSPPPKKLALGKKAANVKQERRKNGERELPRKQAAMNSLATYHLTRAKLKKEGERKESLKRKQPPAAVLPIFLPRTVLPEAAGGTKSFKIPKKAKGTSEVPVTPKFAETTIIQLGAKQE